MNGYVHCAIGPLVQKRNVSASASAGLGTAARLAAFGVLIRTIVKESRWDVWEVEESKGYSRISGDRLRELDLCV